MERSLFVFVSFCVLLTAGIVISQVPPGQTVPPRETVPLEQNVLPDNQCMGCICEAASRCNTTAGCVNGMCGLFRITFPYWVDAGKPIIAGDNPEDRDAWLRCVNDAPCAGETVVNYLTRFRKDCNGDGVINCLDFASIHHLGGYGCGSRPLEQKYLQQFQDCQQSIASLG